MTAARGNGLYPRNPHNPTPALRALLVALDRWVTEGVEPPASRVPTLAAGDACRARGAAVSSRPWSTAAVLCQPSRRTGKLAGSSPNAASAYTTLVPQVDADGNEIAGIRLPAVAVPLATQTGWNLYKAPYPEGELCDREGSYLPFARTQTERLATADPRASLEERYGTHEAYVHRVKAMVFDLQEARLLLPEDAARLVEEAGCRNLVEP